MRSVHPFQKGWAAVASGQQETSVLKVKRSLTSPSGFSIQGRGRRTREKSEVLPLLLGLVFAFYSEII